MNFLNESWFWTGFFTLVGTLGAVVIKEIYSSRYLIKIERIKLYDSEKFKAYNTLYTFISQAYKHLWPPDDRRIDFIELMKNKFYPDVKSKYLYFDSETREVLKTFEAQYDCLGDDDFIPPIEQKLFLDVKIMEMLESLQLNIEKKTDKVL